MSFIHSLNSSSEMYCSSNAKSTKQSSSTSDPRLISMKCRQSLYDDLSFPSAIFACIDSAALLI